MMKMASAVSFTNWEQWIRSLDHMWRRRSENDTDRVVLERNDLGDDREKDG